MLRSGGSTFQRSHVGQEKAVLSSTPTTVPGPREAKLVSETVSTLPTSPCSQDTDDNVPQISRTCSYIPPAPETPPSQLSRQNEDCARKAGLSHQAPVMEQQWHCLVGHRGQDLRGHHIRSCPPWTPGSPCTRYSS